MVVKVLDVAYRLMDPVQTGPHPVGQDPTLIGEADAPVVPVEQCAPEPPLQLADGVAHRRLPDLQFVGRAGEAVVAGHDGERGEALNGWEIAGGGTGGARASRIGGID